MYIATIKNNYKIAGDDICGEDTLESHNVMKSFVPNLTHNNLDTIKLKDDQELPDEEHSPKVYDNIIDIF